MEYFIALLPLLACPIGMGLLMWLMMSRQNTPDAAGRAASGTAALAATAAVDEGPGKRRWSLGGLCLDRRVLAGLAAVGVAVWLAAPDLFWAALPLLLLAACPLSMLLMMRGMRAGQCAPGPAQAAIRRDERLAALKAQRAEVAHQIAALETAPSEQPPMAVAAVESRG